MEAAPYLAVNGRWGYRMGDGRFYDSMLRDGLNDAFSGEHSGWHTEDLVKSRQITRDAQDRWAERSQKRFSAAQAAGKFKEEITPVELKTRKGPKVFEKDEHNRPDTTLECLAKLHPAFRKDGTITAGNAPGLNSGASAMIVAERSWAEQHKLKPMARLVSYGIGAVEPGMFGLGPIPAVRQALDRAGWKIGDIERIEINEAFAAIVIAVMRELGLSENIVNVEGGAIAHGHPIGARRRADHPAASLDEARRDPTRCRHTVYRRRPGHRVDLRGDALRSVSLSKWTGDGLRDNSSTAAP